MTERGRPAFLASVTSASEAEIALAGGANIIDCKDPASGALGALPHETIVDVCRAVAGRVLVSATIGDMDADATVMVPAAEGIAATGVDLVKCGFVSDDASAVSAVSALGTARLGTARLVAVLMADRITSFDLIAPLARAGFAAVMLDTADKGQGALTDVMDAARLAAFVDVARRHRMISGLAGALRLAHIADIVGHGPDVIGFRGALCDGGRVGVLSAERVATVRDAIIAAHLALGAASTARSVA
ncbi:MAG: (5-formylfuran-3-yl)methyl phosphate synthase [Hyphomicrobium sp.]